MLNKILEELNALADAKRAKASAWFFKTGPGQYAEGDKFLGVSVPLQRKVALKYKNLSFADLNLLLKSGVHEHRFTALEILVMQYENGSDGRKNKIFNFYIKNAKRANNWDLVDTSAPYICGDYLAKRDKSILYKLARSKNLWERRIAIISTAAFIRQESFEDTFKIAEILLQDKHDLIHKAVGWMLREVGKKSLADELEFLNKHCPRMPRTMLRYAIEKFPEKLRQRYLSPRKNEAESGIKQRTHQ